MATSGGMGGSLAADRGAENTQPIWDNPGQGAGGQDDGHRQQQAMGGRPKMNLTKEEMAALQQCSQESFYYRCVPLGLLFMGSTQILVNKQLIKGHPRFGAIPKNMFAGLIAYLIGKISYQGECRRKIMALPNSPLGEAMRQGKRGRDLMGDISLGGVAGGFSAEESSQEDLSSGLKDSYLESGTQGIGLDDNKRPTIDTVIAPAEEEKGQSYVTYDELRKRNRTEHESKSPSKASSPAQPQYPLYTTPQPGSRSKTNKYGDVMED